MSRFRNNETFPSFSDEYASSSYTDNGESFSQGYTFSTDDGDKCNQCLPRIAHNIEKPRTDQNSSGSVKSKITVYNVLSAIDSAVDAVVDVVIPVEKTISKLKIDSPPTSPNRNAKIDTSEPSIFTRKPSSSSKATKSTMDNNKSIELLPEDKKSEKSPKKSKNSLSPKSIKANTKSKSYKNTKSPKSITNDNRESRGKGSMVGTEEASVVSGTTMTSFFSSPKNTKINKDEDGDVEEDKKEDSSGFFFGAFEWMSPTSKEEDVQDEVDVPEKKSMKKKRRLFGRGKKKKTERSEPTENMNSDPKGKRRFGWKKKRTSAFDDRDASDEEHSQMSEDAYDSSAEMRCFGRKKTQVNDERDATDGKIDSFESESRSSTAEDASIRESNDEEWWSTLFWTNAEQNDEAINAEIDTEVLESKGKKIKGFRKIFRSRKSQSKPERE